MIDINSIIRIDIVIIVFNLVIVGLLFSSSTLLFLFWYIDSFSLDISISSSTIWYLIGSNSNIVFIAIIR